MNRSARIAPGCGRTRFASLVSAEKAVGKGAEGTPEQHGDHWHLKAPAPQAGFSAETRLKARKRAGYGDPELAVCEACGIHLGRYGGDIQHRLARGSGGCKDAVVNGLSNAAVLCREHHAQAESRDPHMGASAAGWWIKSGSGPASDPRLVPVLLYSGVIRWLSDTEPRYLEEAPMGAAA